MVGVKEWLRQKEKLVQELVVLYMQNFSDQFSPMWSDLHARLVSTMSKTVQTNLPYCDLIFKVGW